jgi:hypothetical protein
MRFGIKMCAYLKSKARNDITHIHTHTHTQPKLLELYSSPRVIRITKSHTFSWEGHA